MVGGIDYYLIGIALLIFGYGIYELVISDIDPRQQEASDVRRNLLNIESLDGLRQKLTKVIVVALIVLPSNPWCDSRSQQARSC